MRRMFSWRQIPKMMELEGPCFWPLWEEDAALTEAERGNLLGECDPDPELPLLQRHQRQRGRLHRWRQPPDVPPGQSSIKAAVAGPSAPVGSDDVSTGSRRPALSWQRWTNACPNYRSPSGHGQGAETVMRGGERPFSGPLCRRADRPPAHSMPGSPTTVRRNGPCAATFSQLAAGPLCAGIPLGTPSPGVREVLLVSTTRTGCIFWTASAPTVTRWPASRREDPALFRSTGSPP